MERSYEEKGFDIHDELYARIDRMEETAQKIIKFRFFEELTLDEIARILDRNINTVEVKLYRSLKVSRFRKSCQNGLCWK